MNLTDEQKEHVCGILSAGCDRQTAVDYVGCSPGDLKRALRQDGEFFKRVRRTEANIELLQMQNIKEATKDAKNWRASVWWLERRSPERFGARGPGAFTARQLKALIGLLVDILRDEVRDAADRDRLIARFNRVVEVMEQMLSDVESRWTEMREVEGAACVATSIAEPAEADETEEAWEE